VDLIPNRPDQVLTFAEWCFLNSFSQRTGRRFCAAGSGPVITQLSKSRIGVTVASHKTWKAYRERARIGIKVADNLRWQKSRARKNPAKAAAPKRRRHADQLELQLMD